MSKKKKVEFTPTELKVYNLLQVGKDNAISRDQLVKSTGYGDRYIRKILRSLRAKGIRIVSYSTGSGYWLSGSREDDQHYANEMRKRGQECKEIVKGINISLGKTKHVENQESLFRGDENET